MVSLLTFFTSDNSKLQLHFHFKNSAWLGLFFGGFYINKENFANGGIRTADLRFWSKNLFFSGETLKDASRGCDTTVLICLYKNDCLATARGEASFL